MDDLDLDDLEKLKGWRGNLWIKTSTQQISKKHYIIIKSKMYNLMCVDEMKIIIWYVYY